MKFRSIFIITGITVVSMSLPACSGLTPVTSEESDVQEDAFDIYLKRIYKNADEYFEGHPVYRDTDTNTIRIYNGFSKLDYDGDGEEELFLYCSTDTPDYKDYFNARETGKDIDIYREIDRERLQDMFVLCEYDGREVWETSGKVMIGAKDSDPFEGLVFRSSGSVARVETDTNAVSKGIKYSEVGFFDRTRLAEMINAAGGDPTAYIYYNYYEPGESIQWDRHTPGTDYSHGISVTDEDYAKHLAYIESGDIVDISCIDFNRENVNVAEAELDEPESPERQAFMKYLRDIYQNKDIINGYPVEIEDDGYDTWWTAYKKFAIGDFDGDGAEELLLQTYGPYNSGLRYMDESITENAYPYFKMYEAEGGSVKDRDTEKYKMHGDIWLAGLHKQSILSSGFTFFDNAVFRYSFIDDDGVEAEAFYIFDDDIYRKLAALEHEIYLEWEGESKVMLGDPGSAICYAKNVDGTITRKVGSHQDGGRDEITRETYDEEMTVLTGANVVDAVFKDLKAVNIGADERADTLEESTINEDAIGLSDLTLSGTVQIDDTTTDSAGNPEPTVVLRLDKDFFYNATDLDNTQRVHEVQLGLDSMADIGDLKTYEGRHITVTGTSFSAGTAHHHRPMVVLVKTVEGE